MILGNGIDIIEIKRIEHAIQRWGDHFIDHVYTCDEISHAQKFKYPSQHFAGRFAAKEAIFKALGDEHVTWQDLNIINDAQGKPVCHFKTHRSINIFLSISHCKEYAVAHAIVSD